MKRLLIPILLMAFYCIPHGDGLFCRMQDFEQRAFDGKDYRCYGKGESYRCVPFDNGAMILEPVHGCPSSPWGNILPYVTYN